MNPVLSFTLAAAPAAFLALGCGGMQQQYNHTLDNAVTVSNPDYRSHSSVAVDAFPCRDSGARCAPHWGQAAADQLAMTLGRLGYQVFDTAQFQTWLVSPPTVIVAAEPGAVGASIHVGPDGASIHASDGVTSVEAGVHADGTGAGVSARVTEGGPAMHGGLVIYESLPVESRRIIVERSGIQAVASGQINVSAPDDVTNWQEVHILIRLADASSGALIWQGEWKDTVMDDGGAEQSIRESMQHLERALQRKVRLQ